MSSATALYTPAVLGLATSLANYPLGEDLPLRAAARAPLCGSTIELGLALDEAGRISAIGLKSHACAIGQAAAALFAGAAPGKDRADLAATLAGLEAWLNDGAAPLPDWPGLDAIVAARSYPARHGAILLPWKAALAALP
ncbi:MAG: iron-sulfur cluster assembly scaffold protein [Novosphingobium sp.]